MDDYRICTFRRLSVVLLPAALILVLSAPAFAQRGPSRSTNAAAKARDNELYQREMQLKMLGKNGKKIEDKERRLLLVQIKEDFEQIQHINNETMRSLTASKSLDYKLISDTLSEINKRAKRLKSNLAMPDVEGKPQQRIEAANSEQLMDSLHALDDLIMSFVSNPLFQNPSVINVELSNKAGEDLSGIINMSQNVKKNAEKLNKSSDRR
jgi:hypothetical protein